MSDNYHFIVLAYYRIIALIFPMNLEEAKRLISAGENLHTEFKLKFPEPEKIVREAIAFANTSGGFIFVGVDDDKTIRGLKDPDEAEQAFSLAVQKYSLPQLHYSAEQIPVTAKRSLLAVRIPESDRKPHILRGSPEFPKGMAFVRVNDKSIQASRELFHILRHSLKKSGTKFHFGEKEKRLMEYLAYHPFIQLQTLVQIAGIGEYEASRTLVMLTRANVLRIEPDEKADRYFLVESDLGQTDQ